MFVHGAEVCFCGATTRLKWSTIYSVETANKITDDTEFTALGLLQNMNIGCQKDSHNEVDSENVVTWLAAPQICGWNMRTWTRKVQNGSRCHASCGKGDL